ncbi:hypothetical protein GA707_11830 [Nostocoides sp. F2B08]|uniref:hypothetical protein n=1 Tax=Nostocoides sp. F2B08 TaxID=2653936 RepID=UPI001263ACCF|nr:hypothetical protein [Tetrasphaera sp. F2B08]KAB7744131.1 hypothetical protein GA707_11830 [Tetrasphaera sp. F2B08]
MRQSTDDTAATRHPRPRSTAPPCWPTEDSPKWLVPEGLQDEEIWNQEQVDRVHAYDLATCGAPVCGGDHRIPAHPSGAPVER